MDPTTLLAATAATIKATCRVGKTIDTFVDPPPEVTALFSELDSLINVVLGIQSWIESNPRKHYAFAKGTFQLFLTSISASLQECQTLLGNIEAMFTSLENHVVGSRILFRVVAGRLRLTVNVNDVTSFQKQLSSFRETFQFALQTTTLYGTVQEPYLPDAVRRIDALCRSSPARDPLPEHISEAATALFPDTNSVSSIMSDLIFFDKSEAPLQPRERSSVSGGLNAISNHPPKGDFSGSGTDELEVRVAARKVVSTAQNESGPESARRDGNAKVSPDGQGAKMRLLNTTTLTFHEFLGNEIPYYAILSHRWGLDEVTFQDLQNNRENMKTVGWEKVIGCCAQARKEGWDYVWIDSCCIDKSSSAELSESINSMYLWYQNSQVCYAYLNDVSAEKDHERAGSAFRNSSWFTRGWTLQELLAPQNVFFFNREWVEIGTKSTFDQLIASITGIDRQFLEGGFERASIAQKFSWASKRQTLRIEDMAYCLMGLFGVNMPLLYGEGSKAFIRLQLEIMKVSDDDSLFAWTDWSIQATPSQTTGLLANSPAAFQQSANIVSLSGGHKATTPHSMTNRGLSISLVLMPAEEAWSKGVQSDTSEVYPYIPESSQSFAPLSCSISKGNNENLHILLRLARTTNDKGHQVYARLCSTRLHLLPTSSIFPGFRKEQLIFVPQTPYLATTKQSGRTSKFAIHARPFSKSNVDYWVSSALSGKLASGRGNWYRPVEAGCESVPILKLGASENDSVAFIEFMDDTGGHHAPEEAFVLQICQDFTNPGTVGIDLLPSDGSPLDQLHEFVLESHKDKPVSRRDRATIALPSGRRIFAALRKRALEALKRAILRC